MTYTGDKPNQCNICDKAFRVKGHLMNHTGEKSYQGNQVGTAFSKVYKLKHHLWTHPGEKPYKYNLYDKDLQFKYHLTTHCHSLVTSHLEIHTGEKPYICNLCDNDFKFNSYLASHLKKHAAYTHVAYITSIKAMMIDKNTYI